MGVCWLRYVVRIVLWRCFGGADGEKRESVVDGGVGEEQWRRDAKRGHSEVESRSLFQ